MSDKLRALLSMDLSAAADSEGRSGVAGDVKLLTPTPRASESECRAMTVLSVATLLEEDTLSGTAEFMLPSKLVAKGTFA